MPGTEEVIAHNPITHEGADAHLMSPNPWSSVAASVYSDLTGRNIQKDTAQLISGGFNSIENGMNIASKGVAGAAEMILSNFSLKDDKGQNEITKLPDLMEKLSPEQRELANLLVVLIGSDKRVAKDDLENMLVMKDDLPSLEKVIPAVNQTLSELNPKRRIDLFIRDDKVGHVLVQRDNMDQYFSTDGKHSRTERRIELKELPPNATQEQVEAQRKDINEWIDRQYPRHKPANNSPVYRPD